MEQLAVRLANIDRRIIFVFVALICLAPLVMGFWIPNIVSPPTQALFDTVAKTPPDKLVVLHTNWDPGTSAENGPQTEALMAHLFKLKRRFAILSMYAQQGPTLAEGIADKVAKEFGAQYGKDWVNWGFKTGGTAWQQALPKNVPGALGGKDWKAVPLSQLPVMNGVKTFDDNVSLVVDITPSGTLGDWIAFVGQPHHVPIGFACTAVMAPEAYPFLDSGQIIGLMTGMAGAAQYFQLLGRKGFVTLAMTSQAMAHFLILALIAIGNVGYFAGRRAQRQEVSVS
jgi:hypothetical protein